VAHVLSSRTACLLGAVVLLTAGACSGGDDPIPAAGGATAAAADGTAGADEAGSDNTSVAPPTGGDTPVDAGALDCGGMRIAQGDMNLHYQLMNQLSSDEQYAALVSLDLGLDPQVLRHAAEVLAPVAGVDVGVFTPVSEVLDHLEMLAGYLEENLASSAPFVDASGQDLYDLVQASFVGDNASISSALEQAGCPLA
jgi:hypothetical protein